MLRSAVNIYVGHQMLSTAGMELCTYQKFRIRLRTVETMGSILSHVIAIRVSSISCIDPLHMIHIALSISFIDWMD